MTLAGSRSSATSTKRLPYGVTRDRYQFDEDSYDAVLGSGADLASVMAVLHGHPRHREFIGSRDMYVTGRALDGRLLTVGLTEVADNTYRVVSAHFLTDEQASRLNRLF